MILALEQPWLPQYRHIQLGVVSCRQANGKWKPAKAVCLRAYTGTLQTSLRTVIWIETGPLGLMTRLQPWPPVPADGQIFINKSWNDSSKIWGRKDLPPIGPRKEGESCAPNRFNSETPKGGEMGNCPLGWVTQGTHSFPLEAGMLTSRLSLECFCAKFL